ncbi:MAG: hypothetical protein KKD18_04345 [Nanoarchaeota archaeon]|nr:hypothetical protein [Nanoarchaeota archaeon]MBU0977621.1 hypothetical protein [Nanoarchaeota archaeon]
MVGRVFKQAIHTTRRPQTVQEPDREKQLVVLAYADNTCYTRVLSLAEAREVDPALFVYPHKGTWSFMQRGLSKPGYRERTIGEGIAGERGSRGGIIGVYDATNLEHLNAMVHMAREATREPSSPLDD